MNIPKKDNPLGSTAEGAEEQKQKKEENVLAESELDSVNGGVAPIIKPPSP